MEINLDVIIKAYSYILKDGLYLLYFLSALIDILSGLSQSFVNTEYSSEVNKKGLISHSLVTILIVALCPMLNILGLSVVGKTILLFYISSNILSVLKNLDKLGVPFPDGVRKYFTKINESMNNKNIEEYDGTNNG